jgi:hypothetical protein
MDEEISDGVLIDVCGVDMADLLTEPANSRMKTALDRVLMSSADECNGFNQFI